MNPDLKLIEDILPSHYKVSHQDKGVKCTSSRGIVDDSVWDNVLMVSFNTFAWRFMEVYHHVCTNHTQFTIFLKKINIDMESKLWLLRKRTTKLPNGQEQLQSKGNFWNPLTYLYLLVMSCIVIWLFGWKDMLTMNVDFFKWDRHPYM